MKRKAQDGEILSPYMQKRAAQDKIKAENVRKKDSIMQRNANATGKDLASYKKDARANSKVGYQSVPKGDRDASETGGFRSEGNTTNCAGQTKYCGSNPVQNKKKSGGKITPKNKKK